MRRKPEKNCVKTRRILIQLSAGFLCLTLFFTASSAFADSVADSKDENALLAAGRLADANSSTDLQKIEPKALAEPNANATRQGELLILHLGSGGTKSYSNSALCAQVETETQCVEYSLVVHAVREKAFVVAKFYYESTEFMLVDDDTGDETILRAFPAFSPSGSWVLVTLEDENLLSFGMQIWRRDGHRFVVDWSRVGAPDGIYSTYKLIDWSSDDVIDVQEDTNFGDPKKSDVLQNIVLRCVKDKWQMTKQ